MANFSNQYTPATTLTIHTWRGETYEIEGDMFNWTRTKSLSQPQGTFTINLTAAKDKKGLTWADKLKPMDYVEIRASRYGTKKNGKLPIIMRGFIDDNEFATQFGTQNGPSEPRISIPGRDYAKLLLEWQILYLFTQNTFKTGGNIGAIVGQSKGFGLFYNFHLPLMPTSITSFFNDSFSKLVTPILDGLKGYKYPTLPMMKGEFDFPNYPMSSLNVMSYTGSYWNLFDYFSSPPFGELFVIDTEEAPTLVSRMAPYQTVAGTTPAPGKALPVALTIEDTPVVNISQSDSDVYTYFLTYGASTQLVGITMPAFATGKGNGIQTKWANLYGIRPLQVDTSWIAEYDANDPTKPNANAIEIGSTLNQWLVATQGDNQLWWNGTIEGHGNENYQIGTYIKEPSTGKTFYLAGISDNYEYEGNQWTTQLQVVRGR